MKITRLFVASCCIFLFSCSSSPSADNLIRHIKQACGSPEAWEQSRYFKFTFRVDRTEGSPSERHHYWDRYTGNYRVEYVTKQGDSVTVLFNTNSRKGQVFIKNEPAQEDTLIRKHLDRAYKLFINDTYWLIAPMKLDDPGVMADEQPEELINDRPCRVLHIRFQNGIGLTSGDQYWFYADAKTGEVIRWKYLLEDKEEAVIDWKPYEKAGMLKLSLVKESVDKTFTISFPGTEISNQTDTLLFSRL